MYRLTSFFILGLALFAFQVVEVEAQRGDPRGRGDVRGEGRDAGRDAGRDVRGEGRDSGRDMRGEGRDSGRDMRGEGRDSGRDPRAGRLPARDPRGPANPPARRGDGRVTDAERDARYRDTRPPARDTRVREDTRTPAKDSRGAASADPRGAYLSKQEKVKACKKQYGKGRKNKAAKQACIEAAKR